MAESFDEVFEENENDTLLGPDDEDGLRDSTSYENYLDTDGDSNTTMLEERFWKVAYAGHHKLRRKSL